MYLNTSRDKDGCIHIEYNVDYNCDCSKKQVVNFESQNIFNCYNARKCFEVHLQTVGDPLRFLGVFQITLTKVINKCAVITD